MREDELEEYYDREDRLQMAPRLQALRNREEYIELVGQEQGAPGDPLRWYVRNHTDEGLGSGARWEVGAPTPQEAVRKAYVKFLLTQCQRPTPFKDKE